MALLENLSIEVSQRFKAEGLARLRIRFDVSLNARERRVPGLRFKEKIQLFCTHPSGLELFLYELEPALFDAGPAVAVQRERLLDLPLEDGLDLSDGLTARVWLTPRLPEPASVERPLESCF